MANVPVIPWKHILVFAWFICLTSICHDPCLWQLQSTQATVGHSPQACRNSKSVCKCTDMAGPGRTYFDMPCSLSNWAVWGTVLKACHNSTSACSCMDQMVDVREQRDHCASAALEAHFLSHVDFGEQRGHCASAALEAFFFACGFLGAARPLCQCWPGCTFLVLAWWMLGSSAAIVSVLAWKHTFFAWWTSGSSATIVPVLPRNASLCSASVHSLLSNLFPIKGCVLQSVSVPLSPLLGRSALFYMPPSSCLRPLAGLCMGLLFGLVISAWWGAEFFYFCDDASIM